MEEMPVATSKRAFIGMNRRRFLAGAATFAGATLLPRVRDGYARELPPPAAPQIGGVVDLKLVAAERPTALPCFGGDTLPLWTFTDSWPPVVRLKLGDRLDATLREPPAEQGRAFLRPLARHAHRQRPGRRALSHAAAGLARRELPLFLRAARHGQLLLPSALQHGGAARPWHGGPAHHRRRRDGALRRRRAGRAEGLAARPGRAAASSPSSRRRAPARRGLSARCAAPTARSIRRSRCRLPGIVGCGSTISTIRASCRSA